jgi:hypothetical protein
MAVINYRIIEKADMFVVEEDIGGVWTVVSDGVHDQLKQARRRRRQLRAIDPERPFVVI